MLAVKIFQGDPDDLNSALIGHVENNESSCGLEVALYQGIALPSEQIERIAALPSNNKILHTYHRVIGLTELEREDPSSLTRLLAESDVAKAMGISKAVVHSVTFADKRKGFPLARQTASSWVKNLERMHSLGLRAHLENTTEPLSWHQELFDEWDKWGGSLWILGMSKSGLIMPLISGSISPSNSKVEGLEYIFIFIQTTVNSMSTCRYRELFRKTYLSLPKNGLPKGLFHGS